VLVQAPTAWPMLEAAFGLGPDDVEIYRQVIYEFSSQLLHGWRHGRILLSGDAAHQMAPFIGQGACAALRDAIALAWRLDLVLRDQAPETLLDTYEQERKPHVRTQIETSAVLGHIACEHDPDRAKARDATFLSGHAPPPPPEPELGDGVLHRGPDGTRGILAGRLGHQGVLGRGGKTGRADDLLDWGFALLARGRDPREVLSDDQQRFLADLGCRLVPLSQDRATTWFHDVEGTYAAFFDEHGVEAVIVRPDFVVFGAAPSFDDLPGLVDDLRAQLAAPVTA
jgi:3-(3-hydroxy-phenyl)propionate hydroxylase